MWVQRVAARRSQKGGERQLQLGDVLATGHRGPLGQQLTPRCMDGGAGHMSGLGGRVRSRRSGRGRRDQCRLQPLERAIAWVIDMPAGKFGQP
jgi:hypothetical protein